MIPLPLKPYRQNTLLVLGGDVWPMKSQWKGPTMDYLKRGFGNIVMEDMHAQMWDAHMGVHTVSAESSIMIPSFSTIIHFHQAGDSAFRDRMIHNRNMRHIILSSSTLPEPILWKSRKELPSFLWLCSGIQSTEYRTIPFVRRYSTVWTHHAQNPDFHPHKTFDMHSGFFISHTKEIA